MAWTIVGLLNPASFEVLSGDLTLAEPSGVQQGDLLVACIAYRSNAAFGLPANWNLVATQQSSGNTDATQGIASGVMAYIVRGASAPSYVFTRTGGDVAQGTVIAYRGNHSSPYDTGGAATLGTIGEPSLAAISTAEAGELIVAMISHGDNSLTVTVDAATAPSVASGATDTTTNPTNDTWIERVDRGANTGADTGLCVADGVKVSSGSTGAFSADAATTTRSVFIVGAFKLAPAAVSVNLSAAALASSGPALDQQSGAVSKSLVAAGLSATGPQASISAPAGSVTVNLSPATLASSGPALDQQSGAVTINLLPAFLYFWSSLNRTLFLSTASLSAIGQAIIVVPGAISRNLSAAAISASGQALTVQPGAVSRTLNAGALASAGQTLTIQAGAVSTSLSPASLVAVGQALTVQAGAFSLALGAASVSASGQTITVSAPTGPSISLSAALLAALGQTLGVQPGAVSKALLAAALSALGQAITINAPPLSSIGLNAALLASSSPQLDVQPGAISRSLSAATLSALGQALDVQPGVISKLLGAAVLSASGQTLTAQVGTATVTLSTAALAILGQVLDPQPGATNLSLNNGLLTANGQTLTVQANLDISISLDSAVLDSDGTVITIIGGTKPAPPVSVAGGFGLPGRSYAEALNSWQNLFPGYDPVPVRPKVYRKPADEVILESLRVDLEDLDELMEIMQLSEMG